MKKKHREILTRLMEACNKMGNQLDFTATTNAKLVDRQRIHGKISKVLYGLMLDHPDNDDRDIDWENMIEALEAVESIAYKEYSDRNNIYKTWNSANAFSITPTRNT